MAMNTTSSPLTQGILGPWVKKRVPGGDTLWGRIPVGGTEFTMGSKIWDKAEYEHGDKQPIWYGPGIQTGYYDLHTAKRVADENLVQKGWTLQETP
jgi:hypothetical protein